MFEDLDLKIDSLAIPPVVVLPCTCACTIKLPQPPEYTQLCTFW